MKKLLILAIVLSLCGCSVMEKISNKPYWEEVCIEPYAYYDSCHQIPKKFMISARTMIYMTDSGGTPVYLSQVKCCMFDGIVHTLPLQGQLDGGLL